MPLKQQSSCGPALSTDAGRALSKLTGQLLQIQGSRCVLDGKDMGPMQIIFWSPLKAAWKVGSAVSTGSKPGGKSPAWTHRWVSFSQPTGGSQAIPCVPGKFGCQWAGKKCAEVALEPDGVQLLSLKVALGSFSCITSSVHCYLGHPLAFASLVLKILCPSRNHGRHFVSLRASHMAQNICISAQKPGPQYSNPHFLK